MTAPVSRADVATDLPEPPSLAVAHGDAAGSETRGEHAAVPATSAWAWLAGIAVLALAVAGTCTVLLIQWTSAGSGTVAR